MEDSPTSGVLDGFRVLDLSRFIAGPICGQILGDFGAEVVKVERPGGEDARHHDPFYEGESLYTMLYNRNKHAVTLDTRHPSAKPILEALVEWADVVVENYRPGTLSAMGLDFERMRTINEDIVLVSISGFGQTGPDSRRTLFDAIAQVSSGLMSITGEPDGAPTLTGTYIADYVTGFQAAIGGLAALIHRERTGQGQLVDVASFDATFSILGTRLIAYLMLGITMPRNGARDLLTAPVNLYPCKDGSIYIQAGTDGLFRRLCRAIERPDLLDNEDYRDVAGRMANAELLESAVAGWARDRTVEEIGVMMDDAGIPNARAATIPDVVESPQLAARQMIAEVDHPDMGSLKIPGIPIKMSLSPPTIRKPPPRVGEDNRHVYMDLLGLDHDEYAKLKRSGAI